MYADYLACAVENQTLFLARQGRASRAATQYTEIDRTEKCLETGCFKGSFETADER